MKTYRAGESTRELATQRREKQKNLLLLMIIFSVVLLLTSFLMQTWGMGITALLVLIAGRFVVGAMEGEARKQRKREGQAIRGAVAEEEIGTILAQLGDGHLVLHDVRSRYGNIDHVVISRRGIFLVETKSHGGEVVTDGNTLLVNGRPPEKNFIQQCLNNVYWMKAEIEPVTKSDAWITALLVFSNAFVKSGTIKGVRVINKRYLTREIENGRTNLAVWEKREEIVHALRKAEKR